MSCGEAKDMEGSGGGGGGGRKGGLRCTAGIRSSYPKCAVCISVLGAASITLLSPAPPSIPVYVLHPWWNVPSVPGLRSLR